MKQKGIVLVVVFAFLIVIAGYYVFYSDGFNRQSSLVGDATCGSLTSQSAQDKCCANIHSGEPMIECVGARWEYNSNSKLCSQVCKSYTQESCEAANGKWRKWGPAPDSPSKPAYCIFPKSDVNKSCSDDSQCLSRVCVAPVGAVVGSSSNGNCSLYDINIDQGNHISNGVVDVYNPLP